MANWLNIPLTEQTIKLVEAGQKEAAKAPSVVDPELAKLASLIPGVATPEGGKKKDKKRWACEMTFTLRVVLIVVPSENPTSLLSLPPLSPRLTLHPKSPRRRKRTRRRRRSKQR